MDREQRITRTILMMMMCFNDVGCDRTGKRSAHLDFQLPKEHLQFGRVSMPVQHSHKK